jgi:hypothetical protein
MIESLNAVHISENLANYEAARTGFFTLLVGNGETFDSENADTFNSINGLPSAYADKAALPIEGSNTQQKLLALNVVKAFVPHFSLEVLEYKRGNEKVKFAGTPSYESGSLTVDDVVGIDTKNILLAWQAQAYDVHTGKGGRMKHYKKNCTLIEYTQDYEQVRQWDLRGCWISALSEDDFDKENDGKRQISVTIEYDKAIPVKKVEG